MSTAASRGTRTSRMPTEADDDAGPLPRRDPLAEQGSGEQRGEQRLQGAEKPRDPGRQPLRHAHQTPLRYPPCSSTPATMLCPASRTVAGHGARLATTIKARTTIVIPKRAIRNVNGSASGAAYLATMKPLDQRNAKGQRRGADEESGGLLGRHGRDLLLQCPIRPRRQRRGLKIRPRAYSNVPPP